MACRSAHAAQPSAPRRACRPSRHVAPAVLCRALRALGRTAYLLENPEITETYTPYAEGLWAPKGYVPQSVVSVDIAAPNLLPENAAPIGCEELIERAMQAGIPSLLMPAAVRLLLQYDLVRVKGA